MSRVLDLRTPDQGSCLGSNFTDQSDQC